MLTVRFATVDDRRGILLRVMWQQAGGGVHVVGPVLVERADEAEEAVLGALRDLNVELAGSYASD